jgi:hypothetical protein
MGVTDNGTAEIPQLIHRPAAREAVTDDGTAEIPQLIRGLAGQGAVTDNGTAEIPQLAAKPVVASPRGGLIAGKS